jgi:hypothetical protein
VAIFAAGLVRPRPDGVATLPVASFVVHDGIFGEAGNDAIGIVHIGGGEIVAEGHWQFEKHAHLILGLLRSTDGSMLPEWQEPTKQ